MKVAGPLQRGNIVGNAGPRDGGPARSPLAVAPRDAVLLQFCKASTERVVKWREKGDTTNDFGFSAAMIGHESFTLFREVYDQGHDPGWLRRQLAPLIDTLAQVGSLQWASELRLHMRVD